MENEMNRQGKPIKFRFRERYALLNMLRLKNWSNIKSGTLVDRNATDLPINFLYFRDTKEMKIYNLYLFLN